MGHLGGLFAGNFHKRCYNLIRQTIYTDKGIGNDGKGDPSDGWVISIVIIHIYIYIYIYIIYIYILDKKWFFIQAG